jgi:hypothetical protein
MNSGKKMIESEIRRMELSLQTSNLKIENFQNKIKTKNDNVTLSLIGRGGDPSSTSSSPDDSIDSNVPTFDSYAIEMEERYPENSINSHNHFNNILSSNHRANKYEKISNPILSSSPNKNYSHLNVDSSPPRVKIKFKEIDIDAELDKDDEDSENISFSFESEFNDFDDSSSQHNYESKNNYLNKVYNANIEKDTLYEGRYS